MGPLMWSSVIIATYLMPSLQPENGIIVYRSFSDITVAKCHFAGSIGAIINHRFPGYVLPLCIYLQGNILLILIFILKYRNGRQIDFIIQNIILFVYYIYNHMICASTTMSWKENNLNNWSIVRWIPGHQWIPLTYSQYCRALAVVFGC